MPVSVVCDAATVNAAIRDSIATSASNGCSGTNDDSQTLQSKFVASAKRVLLSKIEYEEVNNYSQSVLDTLKSKYIVLKPSTSVKLNNSGLCDKETNQISSLTQHATPGQQYVTKDPNQVPQAKRILFPRESVQIGWKSSGRKWQVGSGMMNVGNTCYLNSTLQAIFHVPAMANWLMSDATHREKCEDENGSQGGCIICAMSKTLISSQTSQSHIRPYLVYSKLRLVCKHLIMGRQEDAHEFLRYLVEAMEKSYLTRFRNSKELDQYSKETTPLNQILGGYLKSAVRCLACGHISTTFQHFQDLLLDIRKANTIEEALDGYFARERLEDMGYKCEACKKKVSATKQFSLERAPISLCIQLKRFSMMGTKLNKHVAIRPRLDLTPYASKNNREQLTYKLVAMVTHLGASQHCGHYTAIGLTDSGGYYQFDDSCVRPISIQNVLNTNAYIIFYELEDNHQHSRQTSTQISRDHNDQVKETPSKTNGQIQSNENGLQRQNSTSTNNTNTLSLNTKLISKLEANNSVTLIGPQLPNKNVFNKNEQQRNGGNSTIGSNETTKICQNGMATNNSSKLVNSPNQFKQNNGDTSNSNSTFQTPNQKSNQALGNKLTIQFKNRNNSTNSTNSYNSSNNKCPNSEGSKVQNNFSKLGNRTDCSSDSLHNSESLNINKSSLPSMPKLELSALNKSSTMLNGYSQNYLRTTNSNEKSPTANGFVKSPSNEDKSRNIKSLVPYESDDDSNDSNDELAKDKDCERRNSSTANNTKNSRLCESDNESSSSDDLTVTSNTRPTPPSPPVVKTKAGLWQVTSVDLTQNDTHPEKERKNPFASATTTISASSFYSNNTNKLNGKEKKLNGKHSEVNTNNVTVQQLLKLSHRGYGAPVLSWNGQKTNMEKEVTEEIRLDRKREMQDDEENEMDRGRQKKVKVNGPIGRENPGYNPFQEYQNHQTQNQNRRWNNNNNSHNRFYQGNTYRQNAHHRNHNNFRRNRFHQRQHHQQRNGTNGFHHRRDS